MKKFAVFLATTGGPVQVLRLTPERAPQSMMCLSRSSTILPISGEYDDFVRRGSGVIEREFGPFNYESFRADVSETVGSGQSWQLAFFIAHAAEALEGTCLVEDEGDADQVIWATGRVDYDLNILPVDHITEKLQTSGPLFDKFVNSSRKVTILASSKQSKKLISAEHLGPNFEIISAENTAEALKFLGLNSERSAPEERGKVAEIAATVEVTSSPRISFKPAIFVIAAAALIIISIFVIDTFVNRRSVVQETEQIELGKTANLPPEPVTPVEQVKPEQGTKSTSRINSLPASSEDDLKVTVFALAPPEGRTCKDVLFDDIAPKKQELKFDTSGIIPASPLSDVCRLMFAVDLNGPPKFVALRLDVKSGSYLKMSPLPETLNGSLNFKGTQSWSIELPRRLKEPFSYRLIVASGDEPLSPDKGLRKYKSDVDQTLIQMNERNIKGIVRQHIVNP